MAPTADAAPNIQPAAPPTEPATMAAMAAAAATVRQPLRAELRITLSSARRSGIFSPAAAPKRARIVSACARQAATRAASSGCVASQAFTASCRSAGNSPST